MSLTASRDAAVVSPRERLEECFEELAQLAGQRNAIDGRIVEIVAELDRDGLWGMTGVRSVKALVAWKLGMSDATATTVTAVANRFEEFPRCTAQLREGRLSLDQVGVIAKHAAAGSDEHYAQLAAAATVTQLRYAISLAPRPTPPAPDPQRSITKTTGEQCSTYRITLPNLEAAKLDAALQSHRDALINEHIDDHGPDSPGEDHERRLRGDSAVRAPFPTLADAFMRLVATGWDGEVARRPHGQHTTVIVHLNADNRAAWPHLGPVLSEADRQYLLCDTDCEVWLQRRGQPIGAGRLTRVISRRLRRALEYRDRTCRVPGCHATRGLHAHHIRHWEDGGPTELDNLVLVCPHHHR
ncbi:HNH endonuclease signature motif containing protein, partial [Mycobacterium sp. E740]|uniref:HNH endonuclease signature motif containing protein n=1 Tax=Mycobacterium sp. E740 TaxID=1834149 RepID=UPI0007FD2001